LKKTRLDDNLQGLASKLESLYPPGRCTMHLELACFHHWGMDSHFHLDNSAHLVWDSGLMQSYQNGKATKEKPPLGSNFFKPQNSLKKSKASPPSKVDASPGCASSMVVVSPTPPAGVPPFHMLYPQGFNPFYPYGMGMPSPMFFAPQFGMGGLGNTPLPWGADQSIVPSAGPSHTQPETMQLSSSLPMPNGDIHEFCKQYNLSKDVKRGLEKLEFQIGDDIKNL
ncbi:hypothetical protein DFH94DRAFT_618767, partial [Russula ochroleuca]